MALLLLLTSCSLLTQTPPNQAIELTLTKQLIGTQNDLAQDLGILDRQTSDNAVKSNFKIDSITVQKRDKVADISQLNRPNLGSTVNEVYRVSGKFDATLTADGMQKQQKNNPFEMLLGRQATEDNPKNNPVETWYFIQP